MNPPLYVDIELREEFPSWLNKHGLLGAGAEIGCAHGGHARQFLSQWQGKIFYMVDLWTVQTPDIYRERSEGIDYDRWYQECLELARQDPRVSIRRLDSVRAAQEFGDATLDFVYIDANHAYGPVLADMDAWWPKVKPGGVFGGDDYGNDTNWPNFIEVKRAVDRWMAQHKLTFVVDRRPDWWCIKP